MRLRGPESFTSGGKTSRRVGLPTFDGFSPSLSAQKAVSTTIVQTRTTVAKFQANFCIESASALRASLLQRRPPAFRQAVRSAEDRPKGCRALAQPFQHKRSSGRYAVLQRGPSEA